MLTPPSLYTYVRSWNVANVANVNCYVSLCGWTYNPFVSPTYILDS